MKIEIENTDYKEDRAVLWSGAFNLDSEAFAYNGYREVI